MGAPGCRRRRRANANANAMRGACRRIQLEPWSGRGWHPARAVGVAYSHQSFSSALTSFVASRSESCTVQWLRAQESEDVAGPLGRYIPLVSYSLKKGVTGRV